MQQYVVGFLFTQNRQQVALIKKRKPAWQAGSLNGIGGKREGGEDWPEAMAREFHEEAGVLIPADGWEHTVTLFNEWFELRVFRAFSDLALNVKTMEEEVVFLIQMTELPTLPMIPNLSWLIPLQLDKGLHFPLEPFRDE